MPDFYSNVFKVGSIKYQTIKLNMIALINLLLLAFAFVFGNVYLSKILVVGMFSLILLLVLFVVLFFWFSFKSKPKLEQPYLNLVREILKKKKERPDRTGVGTLSLFGPQMRFDLRTSFPLLTTKHVSFKNVVEELLWMLSGSTDSTVLSKRGVRIWDANGSREFLDKCGFQHRKVGDLGPIYGFQWRHFGAEYRGCHADYKSKGVDQISVLLHQIRTNPSSRRLVLSAWNPKDMSQMVLPPCHMQAQFYVQDGELSCKFYQRSGDMGLGVPYNIASYALLTCILAHLSGLVPGELVHTLGDAHIYKNHITALRQQLKRWPRKAPQLRINPELKDLKDIKASDFALLNYNPHPSIRMKMAV